MITTRGTVRWVHALVEPIGFLLFTIVKSYVGYIRVSTTKQGEKGVSLQEQRDAIFRYAERNGMAVSQWFEERETAAKQGRPVFNQMLKLLRQGEASGVIIHKIDRSARNMKDWANLGELIDAGIDVRFANESLDLHTRGGRLSADIQAVVAADYIRNLREETRKGFYGRLKQGIYPLPAPLGYLDKGKGKVKEFDSLRAPLVRKAFELYAGGRFNLESLVDEMHRLGLRNRKGGTVTRNGLSVVLNNPFYIGIIRLTRTNETFPGGHQPLIPKSLFDRVQHLLTGKTRTRGWVHDFLFRRMLTCTACGYSLIAEKQKGHVYYSCHARHSPKTSVREEAVDEAIRSQLRPLQFSEPEQAYLQAKIANLQAEWGKSKEDEGNALTLRLGQLNDRLGRLTDAFVDGMIEKTLFEERKASLLMQRRELEETLASLRSDERNLPERLAGFLELAGSALLSYETGLPDEKRDLLKIVTSNRAVSGKNVAVKLSIPFSEVASRFEYSNGDPTGNRTRILGLKSPCPNR